MIDNIPKYNKLKNSYNPAHYPANKKISAEEWNALWLSVMYQGNHQEDTLASILNITFPDVITVVNEHTENEAIHLTGEQVIRLDSVPNKQDKEDPGLATSEKNLITVINSLLFAYAILYNTVSDLDGVGKEYVDNVVTTQIQAAIYDAWNEEV